MPSPHPRLVFIDLFCGFGGVTSGVENARLHGEKVAEVAACINHDPMAIQCHSANHPHVQHYIEDIRLFDESKLPTQAQMKPGQHLVLWASLECTNFSNAKGGKPRDADSRTLAEELYRYVDHCNPDYIMIENVREFMSWGPLDERGKPLSRKKGEDYVRWLKEMCSRGYRYEYRLLNAADYGAHTSRIRYFGILAKPGLPIVFPETTHEKGARQQIGFFGQDKRKPWKAVREVLDLQDHGNSIFRRKKGLSENTLKRIYAGLCKFVAKKDSGFITKWLSNPVNGVSRPIGLDEVAPTVTTQNRIGFVSVSHGGLPSAKVYSPDTPARTLTSSPNQQPVFLSLAYSGDEQSKNRGLDDPAATITGIDHHQLVSASWLHQRNGYPDARPPFGTEQPAHTITATGGNHDVVTAQFVAKYYGNGDNISSIEDPSGTLTTKDRMTVISVESHYLDRQFGKGQPIGIDGPAGTVTCHDKHAVVGVEHWVMPTNYTNNPQPIEAPCPTLTAGRHHHYLVNPQYHTIGHSVDSPCPVIIASQDKKPLYMATAEGGGWCKHWAEREDDTEMLRLIRAFMREFGVVDIKIRMLKVSELLRITGFSNSYKMYGTQSEQKKFIGNSVPPVVPQRWTEALAAELIKWAHKKFLADIKLD